MPAYPIVTKADVRAKDDIAASDVVTRGVALQLEGRLADAAQLYQLVLQINPAHVEALRLLGVVHAQQGDLDSAARLMRQSLNHDPMSVQTHNNLGRVLHDAKRPEEAIVCYEAALAIRPGYVVARNNLGAALAAVGRHRDAIPQYREALSASPDHAEALNNLGASLHALGNSEEAAEPLKAALVHRPGFVDARINLARVLGVLGQVHDALRHYELALVSQPDNPVLHVGTAGLLYGIGRHDESIVHYERACSLDPGSGPGHAGLAAVLLEIGRVAEARRCLERALECDPQKPKYYLSLARASQTDLAPRHLDLMLALEPKLESLKADERIDAHFALATALAETGQREKAFEHLLAGNALKRRTMKYDERSCLALFERIRRTFTTEVIQAGRQGASSCLPIFIVGMPRSGSTLVEQVLASHCAVIGAGELTAFRDALDANGVFAPGRSFPSSVPDWTSRELAGIADDYVERLMGAVVPLQAGVERITDKMLDNFMYIGLISMILPNARVIHTRRDPVDTCLSCFSIPFDKVMFSQDLGELGRHYSGYLRLMRHWHAVVPRNTILDVRYEDMVSDFEGTARRIVAHCGLGWDDACLRFHETVRPVRTASVAQVRQPIYRKAVGRWRPDDEVLRPLLDALVTPGDDGQAACFS